MKHDLPPEFTLLPLNKISAKPLFVLHLSERISQRSIESIHRQTYSNWIFSDQAIDPSSETPIYDVTISSSVVLEKSCFQSIASAIELASPEIVYSDYKHQKENKLIEVMLPSWSPHRLASCDYLGPVVSVLRPDVSSQVIEHEKLRSAVRIPRALYIAESEVEFSNRFESFGIQSTAKKQDTTISIIIPTMGQLSHSTQSTFIELCIESIKRQSSNLSVIEIVVVFDAIGDLSYLEQIQNQYANHFSLRLIPFKEAFNFSKKCNLGAESSSGNVLVFLNDDTELLSLETISDLADRASASEVGAVGALAVYPSGKVQHAGITFSRIKPDHAYRGQELSSGFLNELNMSIEVTAVTGACLAISRERFDLVGGWNEELDNSYNDIDLCLRLLELGFYNIQENGIHIKHHEAMSRNQSFSIEEFKKLKSRWGAYLGNEIYLRSDDCNPVSTRSDTALIKMMPAPIYAFLQSLRISLKPSSGLSPISAYKLMSKTNFEYM